MRRGDPGRAGVLWGSVEAELERNPTRFDPRLHGGELLRVRDPRFTAAVDHGRRLDLWDSAAIALEELEMPQTEP